MGYNKIFFLLACFITSLSVYCMEEMNRGKQNLSAKYKYNIARISDDYKDINTWLLKTEQDNYNLFIKILNTWEYERSLFATRFDGIDNALPFLERLKISSDRKFGQSDYKGKTYVLSDPKELDLYKNWPADLRNALEKLGYVKIIDFK